MTSPSFAGRSDARKSSRRLVYHAVPLSRASLLGAGTALLIVHVMWRADVTFAELNTTSLSLSIALFAVEAFIAVALTVAALADILPAAARIRPEAMPEAELPSVDIFILIADPRQAPKAAYSLAAASQLDYPREITHLHLVGVDRAADDADTLAALAERTNASWLAASPEATAGAAINAALARTAGSLILIINAGETPTPDLFRRIAAGFAYNPRLALVDVPTFAIDGDPVLTDIDVSQRLPNDPGHFFKSCLKTIGAASGTLGLGQRTVWRRAALSSSGSCSRWTMRPDAPARLRAAEIGWRRGIVTRPMVATLAPDTVKEYLRQRMTTRIGTIDTALTQDPLLSKGLSMRERLAWMPALFGALMPFAWAVAFALPPLAVLLQIPLYGGIGVVDGAILSLLTMIVALAMAGILNAGLGSGFIAAWSEMLETLLSAPSLFALLRYRDKAERAPDPEHANGLLVILFAVALAGTTAGIAAWFLKPELEVMLAPVLALTIFSACLFACLLGAIAEPRQRRLSPRVHRRVEAELLLGGRHLSGRLSDISVHGARFVASEAIGLQVRALTGMLTLKGAAGAVTLPVQLSRQTEADNGSAFGLAFTGRTVGEFATVVRLAHRSGDEYADLCDARAKPAGLARLFAASSWRGLSAFLHKLSLPTRAEARWVPIHRRTRAH